VGYGVVEKSELFNCMSMEMNGGLNDRATALNTDGKWCRLRELEEGKRVNLRGGLTCVRFKLNVIVRLERGKTNTAYPFYGSSCTVCPQLCL
jgi:hypothetical protein